MFAQADYPDLLVGLGAPDDAAVWRVDDHNALIATRNREDFQHATTFDPWTGVEHPPARPTA